MEMCARRACLSECSCVNMFSSTSSPLAELFYQFFKMFIISERVDCISRSNIISSTHLVGVFVLFSSYIFTRYQPFPYFRCDIYFAQKLFDPRARCVRFCKRQEKRCVFWIFHREFLITKSQKNESQLVSERLEKIYDAAVDEFRNRKYVYFHKNIIIT